MIKIAICICTRRRKEDLFELLLSINKIQVPSNTDISIIIIENDNGPYSEETVNKFANKSRFPVKYFLETNQGISHARNRSVKEAGDCDFCCFVDDDQTVASDWMVELVKCQNEFNADGVSGITPPFFNYDAPEYIKIYHQDDMLPYGTILKQAATGCLLLRKSVMDSIEGPFDSRLNFTGGEDFYMTHQVTKKGGIIRFNPNAISYEIIPKERATIKYIKKRTYRTANTKMIVQSMVNDNFSIIRIIPKTFIRLFLGFLIVIPYYLFGRKYKLLGIFKISYSMGELLFVFGKKNKFYK